MSNLNIQAKNIYLELKELKKNGADTGYILFTIVKNMKEGDIDKVYEKYQDILNGKLIVIEVLSATPLSKEQEKDLEGSVMKKFQSQELVFDYRIDAKIKGGIVVRHNDNLIDLSLSKSISELKI
jgi:F-type H+-transporting ATPase subunit delta